MDELLKLAKEEKEGQQRFKAKEYLRELLDEVDAAKKVYDKAVNALAEVESLSVEQFFKKYEYRDFMDHCGRRINGWVKKENN